MESLVKSLVAAVASTLFCLYEQHFQIVWNDPTTYTAPFSHKCGCTMVACVIWALAEIILCIGSALAKRSAEKSRVIRKPFRPEATTSRYAPAR